MLNALHLRFQICRSMQRSILYIIVESYPYGYGEPFLETELSILNDQFEKIYIVLPTAKKIDKSFVRYNIPKGVEIVELNSRENLLIWVKTLFYWLHPSIRIELNSFKKDFGLKFNFNYFKSISAYLAKSLSFKSQFLKILNKHGHQPTQVALYNYWFTSSALGLAFIKEKQPSYLVLTRTHGWDCYFYRNKENYLPFRPWITKVIDGVLPVSEEGRKHLLSKMPDIDSSKIRVRYLGVDINSSDIQPKFEPKSIRIVSISFVHFIKRINLIIDAIQSIDDINIEWTHIGNWSPQTIWLKEDARIKFENKPNIKFNFTGEIKPNEVITYLQNYNADFLICTSESEGLPVSMMEAMACGVPVLTTSVGGVPEIIYDGVNGFLMPKDSSPIEIGNYIRKLSNLSKDEYSLLCSHSKETYLKKFRARINYESFAKEELHSHIVEKKQDQIDHIPEYTICSRCIIDSNIYKEIEYDINGVCNVCAIYDQKIEKLAKEKESTAMDYIPFHVERMKKEGRGKQYDCLIGISGGVDSSYLAVLLKEWGLRPLAVHIDNGWNTELAVSNIEKLLKQLDLDLITYVVNWEELRDLELSYMAASVVDIDIPNEMPSQAMLYRIAAKHNLKYLITGHNQASEGWLPPAFSHYKYDTLNLNDIHRKFGKVKLKTYPKIGFFRSIYYSRILGIHYFSPLDYMHYDKEEAKKILIEKYGWRDYGGKHFENVYTRFYQSYILPEKFKLDKRRAHLSSLICAGQLTREEALEKIKQPPYSNSENLRFDKEYFIKKLKISETEFDYYIKTPPKKHTDYKSYMNIYNFIKRNMSFIKVFMPKNDV